MKKNTHPKYKNEGLFEKTLKDRIRHYFETQKISKKGNWILFSKTILLFTLLIGVFFVLLYGDMPPPALSFSYLLTLSLWMIEGVLIAFIGFNVMHDGVHGSYSKKDWINTLMGYSLNLLGASSFLWFTKHNLIHHGWVNVKNHDEDVETGGTLRLHKDFPKRSVHRYQHFYAIPLYGVLYFIWVVFTDAKKMIQGKILGHSIKDKIDRKEIIIFVLTKLWYFFIWMFIPIQILGFWVWLPGYVVMMVTCGVLISLVFQIAHVVPLVQQFDDTKEDLPHTWMQHQIVTTANFATKNPVVSWCVGGLNFQIEHHLFPNYSHVHYPAMSAIVKKTCHEFGITYNEYPTVRIAVREHLSFLKLLGS